MAEPSVGINITPAKVGFFLSLIACAGVFWPALNWYAQTQVKEALQDTRITRSEENLAEFRGQIKDLNSSLSALGGDVNELNATIKARGTSQKTEFFLLPPLGLPPKEYATADTGDNRNAR